MTKELKVKINEVPLEHRAKCGALVPWGGAFKPKTYCEIHKLQYEDECPVCANTE